MNICKVMIFLRQVKVRIFCYCCRCIIPGNVLSAIGTTQGINWLLRWRNILVETSVHRNTRRRRCAACCKHGFLTRQLFTAAGGLSVAASNSPRGQKYIYLRPIGNNSSSWAAGEEILFLGPVFMCAEGEVLSWGAFFYMIT